MALKRGIQLDERSRSIQLEKYCFGMMLLTQMINLSYRKACGPQNVLLNTFWQPYRQRRVLLLY